MRNLPFSTHSLVFLTTKSFTLQNKFSKKKSGWIMNEDESRLIPNLHFTSLFCILFFITCCWCLSYVYISCLTWRQKKLSSILFYCRWFCGAVEGRDDCKAGHYLQLCLLSAWVLWDADRGAGRKLWIRPSLDLCLHWRSLYLHCFCGHGKTLLFVI